MNRRNFLYGTVATAVSASYCSRPADIRLVIDSLSHEVAPGFVYKTTAYNGQVPSPVLRLRQDAPVTVEIWNRTSAEEYVHWHGLELPAVIDGTQEEASLPVPARGHIHYTLTPQQAGLRWIHSHAMYHRGHLDRGVYSGQYGIVYVEPKDNPGAYDREFFLAAHEWGAELTWLKQSEEEQAEEQGGGSVGLPPGGSWEVEYDIGSINGRALGAGEPLRVKEGERVLVHMVNASATVTQKFFLAGHRFEVVALDGNPVPHPQSVEVLELGAGERISAFVQMTNPGVWILGSVRGSDRADGRMGIVVEYAGRSGAPQWRDPLFQPWDYAVFADQELPAELSAERVIPMVIDGGPLDHDGMETWTINGKSYSGIPERLRLGLRCRLSFDNKSDEDHPLHLHRHSFELTKANGRTIAGLWKDTVMLKRYARLEVDFTPTSKGLTLFHCHQQMHMDAGFKKLFEIV